VTHFLRDTLLTPDRQELPTPSENNIANVQGDVITELAVNTSTEAGFEIVTTVSQQFTSITLRLYHGK